MSEKIPIQEFVDLTTELVRQPSITGTQGEVALANLVEKWLMALPYFREHPEFLWTQVVPGDESGRKNVFAFVRGNGSKSQTILFHSHIDTVGVQDYGLLQEYAFEPQQIKSALAQTVSDVSILEHLNSPDWLFGRGSLDMKSGLAVQMKLLEYWSNHVDKLPGNLLLMANPAEETNHAGMLAALSELLRLREEVGLEYLCAVNSDYISAQYPGDKMRYIYTGTTGKLLVNVYIRGAETHVGQAFEGLDPLLVLTELLRELNYNTELVEQVDQEVTQPPVALLARDRKSVYNVQTTGGAVAYWNWFTLRSSPLAVLAKAKERAQRSVARALQLRAEQTARQIQLQGYGAATRHHAVEERTLEMPVYTFAEWLLQLDDVARQEVQQVLSSTHYKDLTKQLDTREVVQIMIERALEAAHYHEPVLLLYLTPPFLPHNHIEEEAGHGEQVVSALLQAAKQVSLFSGEQFVFQRYFPYLSDSSFLRLMIEEAEIEGFAANCPGFGNLFELPLSKSKLLNIPALNLGVYGFDAHKPTERLDIPYSFGTLPELINQFLLRIFEAFRVNGI